MMIELHILLLLRLNIIDNKFHRSQTQAEEERRTVEFTTRAEPKGTKW